MFLFLPSIPIPNSKRSKQAAEEQLNAHIASIPAEGNLHTTGTSRPTAPREAWERHWKTGDVLHVGLCVNDDDVLLHVGLDVYSGDGRP